MDKDEKQTSPGSPTSIVQQAEEIYQRRYKHEYEEIHNGRFVAIDIKTEETYLGDSSGEALSAARKAAPNGVFHLMRVGQPAAFKSSRHRASEYSLGGLLGV